MTSQNFEGFSHYLILYHVLDEHTQCDFVTCSGQVWQKLYIVVEDILTCNQLVLLFYSVISHVSICDLIFLPSVIQLGISHYRVFSSDIENLFNVVMTSHLVEKIVNTFLSTLVAPSSGLICTLGYQNYLDDKLPFYESYVSRSLVSYILLML